MKTCFLKFHTGLSASEHVDGGGGESSRKRWKEFSFRRVQKKRRTDKHIKEHFPSENSGGTLTLCYILFALKGKKTNRQTK